MAKNNHDELMLRISLVESNDRGKATNKNVSWKKLRTKLANPVVDTKYTLPQYLDLHIDKQNKIKDVGSFVGGPFRDGIRQSHFLIERSIITLDIDNAFPRQIDLLKEDLSKVCKYEFYGSTTRKHTSKKPRWRLVFPLTKPLLPDEYMAASRILASKLFHRENESMEATDDVSYRAAQVMYWPSVCKDAEFEEIHNVGELLDPYELLEEFGDWEDWENLPVAKSRELRRPSQKKAEDPLSKPGIIGAFNRTFSITEAIEEFLSDIYIPGDQNSAKPRYTYVHGSSSNGAIIEDNDTHLYSFHGTDPCAERNVNAFDLVRIHLFGDLDLNEDPDTRQTDLPSFKKMRKLCDDYDDVQLEMQDDDYGSFDNSPVKFKNLDADDEDEDDDSDEDDSDDEDAKPKKKTEPDMSVLSVSDYPAPDFPKDVLGAAWSRRVQDMADSTGAPFDYPAMTLLTAAGSLIGNARWGAVHGGWAEPPCLWTTLVGRPSSNKSPAMTPILNAMRDLEASWIPEFDAVQGEWRSKKLEAEEVLKIWQKESAEYVKAGQSIEPEPPGARIPPEPSPRRAWLGDATIESVLMAAQSNPRGLLCYRDEMSGWFQNMSRYNSGSDRPMWLEAYGGRSYRIDRVKNNGVPTVVRNFTIPMLGGLQPDRLTEVLSSADDGFCARFLYIWPEFEGKGLNEGAETDHAVYLSLERLANLELDEDSYGLPTPVVMKMSDSAKATFKKWYDNRVVAEDTRGTDGVLLSAFGKAPGLVVRLAVIIEHLWWCAGIFGKTDAPTQISNEAVKAAIRLRDEYLKPMQVRAYGHMLVSELERNGAKLAGYIQDQKLKSVDAKSLSRNRRSVLKNTSIGEISTAIDYLVDAGWLIPQDIKPSGKYQKPKRTFKVDDRVHL